MNRPAEYHLDDLFPRYRDFDPVVPVWCAAPELTGCIHRFFDTSPISPSGRYLALTRLAREDRLPRPGDVAAVVLVDLMSGKTRTVAETCGADTQLGAQVQWGADDSQLFFNDVDTGSWRPYGVRMNPHTGERRRLEGTVYMVSPDGRWAASACLARIGRTQPGYGVILPEEHVPENRGAPDDDGLYITDTRTGRTRLMFSLKAFSEVVPAAERAEFPDGAYYAFHVKWNPAGTRIMFVLRYLPAGGRRFGPFDRLRAFGMLITLRPDGSDARLALPARVWAKGGHHPNWCPDGETIMMNLKLDGLKMQFIRVHADGRELGLLVRGPVGSGHPTLHRNGRQILTDSYQKEPAAFGDGTTPIRLIDIPTARERSLVRIRTDPTFAGPGGELRVDPHPAWDRGYRYVTFNACPDGVRRVLIADLKDVLL